MNPKQYELPTPESAELEPLAKALVALRRDEEPLAPSAELRRLVEARLAELETNAQGKVITKEKAVLKNSTSRFRLRDWVFFAGGSIAAAVATAIIFWPPPRTDVAGRPESKAKTSQEQLLEMDEMIHDGHFQTDVTQLEANAPRWELGHDAVQGATTGATLEFAENESAKNATGPSSGSGGGVPGAYGEAAGGPGMAGGPGRGAGGMSGMPGMAGMGAPGMGMPGMGNRGGRGGPGGVGGMAGGMPGMPGGMVGGPGGGKYPASASPASQASVAAGSNGSAAGDPATILALKGKSEGPATGPAPNFYDPNGQSTPHYDYSSPAITGGGEPSKRMAVVRAPTDDVADSYRMAVRAKERSGEALGKLRERQEGERYHAFYFARGFQN